MKKLEAMQNHCFSDQVLWHFLLVLALKVVLNN